MTDAEADKAFEEREEYVRQCKKRALAYLDHGKVADAITSMLSDMDKRPDTKVNSFLGSMGMNIAMGGDSTEARRFIIGFH